MLKDGKYRYTLQFGSDTVEEVNAGELLDKLGRRKSAVIVKALNDYLEQYPELMDPCVKIQVDQRACDTDFAAIETKIKEIVDQKVSGLNVDPIGTHDNPEQPEAVNEDILDMLGDLSLFR